MEAESVAQDKVEEDDGANPEPPTNDPDVAGEDDNVDGTQYEPMDIDVHPLDEYEDFDEHDDEDTGHLMMMIVYDSQVLAEDLSRFEEGTIAQPEKCDESDDDDESESEEEDEDDAETQTLFDDPIPAMYHELVRGRNFDSLVEKSLDVASSRSRRARSTKKSIVR